MFYFQTAESNYIEILLSRGVIDCDVTALLALLSLTIVAIIIFLIRKLKVNKKNDNWKKLDKNKGTKECFESQIIWTKNGLQPIFESNACTSHSQILVRTYLYFMMVALRTRTFFAQNQNFSQPNPLHMNYHKVWINIIRK